MTVVSPLAIQKASFETKRKLDMVLEWLAMQARLRQHAQAFGRMQVELVWEGGKIVRAKLIDEITIGDLSDKERELVLRNDAK